MTSHAGASRSTARPDSSGAWEATNTVPTPWQVMKQVWTSRRLLSFLFIRTARRLYRRTVLGWAWLFILPLFPLVLKVLVFGTIMGLPLVGPSYFVFLIAGQISWDLFEGALSWGTRGLSLHGRLQTVRVPRVIMPIGATAPALIEFVINGTILVLSLIWVIVRKGMIPGPGALALSLVTSFAALVIALLSSIERGRNAMAWLFFASVVAILPLADKILSGIAEGLASDDARSILMRADTALYSAKSAGRNRVHRHDGEEVGRVREEV